MKKFDELDFVDKQENKMPIKVVLYGKPGTGKTTTINTILRYYEKEGLDFCLAAPTGRAAKRLSESTGEDASTIHRALEMTGGEDSKFIFNSQNKLSYDVIIVEDILDSGRTLIKVV